MTFPHEDGDETYRYTFMFHEGQLGFRPDDGPWTALALPSGPYEYAPATATATCEFKSEDFSVSANVNFVSEGGMIYLSSAVTLVGKKTVTTYGEGTKID